MKISPARAAAFDILLRIEKEKAYSSALLPIYEDRLSPSDGGLCHELVLGTLRRQILLDRVIDHFASSRKNLDVEVRIALRLGIYQLRFLTRIPRYSAVNESVNLVQRARKTSAKSFVNAVLRKAGAEQFELSFDDEIERISVEQSHPRWLVEKWVARFGIDKTEKLAVANNTVPPLAFRVVGKASDELEGLVANARASESVSGCYFATGDAARIFELANHGEVYIQDEASQMTAHAVRVPDGGRFLDVCAAPGGKTGLITTLSRARFVVAGDLHNNRVKLLQGNCRRQLAAVSVVQYDAENALPFADGSFETVLVDAPCSGTGTIRHNPEIRYRIEPEHFAALHSKQLRILENASKLVKTGGLLVYSTCSLEGEENEAVCEQFVERNAGFLKVKPGVSERFVNEDGYARTWPYSDDMDGFFIACFCRT